MTDDVVNKTRRRVLTAATSVVGAAGVVGAAVPFIGSWNPSAKAEAAGAPVKVNIGKIEPGAMVTAEWRGKPVYIVRRSEQALEHLGDNDDLLRDPSSEEPQQPAYAQNPTRSIKPEVMIVLGLCTHLGCAPLFRPAVDSIDVQGGTWQGGFFCPCHGSKFDLAGRVFKGVPAPTNLEVPPHMFDGENVVIIGEDQEAS